MENPRTPGYGFGGGGFFCVLPKDKHTLQLPQMSIPTNPTNPNPNVVPRHYFDNLAKSQRMGAPVAVDFSIHQKLLRHSEELQEEYKTLDKHYKGLAIEHKDLVKKYENLKGREREREEKPTALQNTNIPPGIADIAKHLANFKCECNEKWKLIRGTWRKKLKCECENIETNEKKRVVIIRRR